MASFTGSMRSEERMERMERMEEEKKEQEAKRAGGDDGHKAQAHEKRSGMLDEAL